MSLSTSTTLISLFCFLIFVSATHVLAVHVSHDGRAITIDGQRRVLLSGSIHYPRSTPQMWPDLIQKSKEGGLDAIETYVFWNAHEPQRRQYDFKGNLDLVRFIKTIQDAGLYAVLRIGPYVCAEWNYGGFPVWLHNMPNIELRTANEVFMSEMQNFTTLIVDMMKENKLFASQGGPIIIAQIENEYGNEISHYGEAGKAYLSWCASMADSLNIGVPWIMCQESDAPRPMINTCNGWYCHDFTPNRPSSPKMWTENWTGWFKSWGDKDPHRTAEDLAFSVARFYQTGGTFQNYYMYHGGTNFGRTAGGPYITTSYDYDAPLDEYGNLNQPKYGHLKQLHETLKSMERTLTHGNISTIDYGNSVMATIYATKEASGCFLSNANSTVDATVSFQGKLYNIPAWSVSVLPKCDEEGYNTAKVNTQTSVMVRKANEAEKQPESLRWSWRPESVNDMVLHGKSHVAANQLMDQKAVASDESDYLWYMTSVNIKEDDPVWSNNMTLWVNTTGQVVHAFVNGQHVGSQFSRYGVSHSVFEQKVKLNKGRSNLITLLSATVGFQNYGANFDLVGNGILGPVQLIGQKGDDEEVIKDITDQKWRYKVGLHGFNSKIYNLDSPSASKWLTEDLPINRMMTWYKTSFRAPLGEEPVVVDLQGLGKGEAWINGYSIGRYWPSYIASEDGCSNEACDYRGPYSNSKCLTNCGQPTQRWYHIPRSFLEDDVNTLVLFEEFGGNPSLVNFQTVSIGTVCADVYEGNTLGLTCHGRTISAVKFASYGNPRGACGSFAKGSCEETMGVVSIVKDMCVGKESCSIDVSEAIFGLTSCGDNYVKRLAVEAVC